MLEVMEQVSNEHDWDSIQKTKIQKNLQTNFISACQTEGSRLLGEMLKEKLLSRVEVSIDNPKSELYTIFSNIDDQGRSNLRYSTQPHRSILPACRRYIFFCPFINNNLLVLFIDAKSSNSLCTQWASISVARSGSRYSERSILITTTRYGTF